MLNNQANIFINEKNNIVNRAKCYKPIQVVFDGNILFEITYTVQNENDVTILNNSDEIIVISDDEVIEDVFGLMENYAHYAFDSRSQWIKSIW